MEGSLTTSMLFVALVATTVGVAGAATVRHGGMIRPGRFIAFAVGAYLVVPGALAWSGILNQYIPMPRPMPVVAGVTAITLYLSITAVGGRLAESLSISWLIGFQVFRVPVELLLHRLATEDVIPEIMTYSGWNFDIITGLSAIVLGPLVARFQVPRALIWLWNVMGLLLLLNIVTIAVLAAPGPFHVFPEGPANTLPGLFPYVWLPTVLVQLALAGHILVFRRLRLNAAV